MVAVLLVYLSTTIVPAGHVGVQDFVGSVSDRILAPGINVSLDVSLLFRLQPEAAAYAPPSRRAESRPSRSCS